MKRLIFVLTLILLLTGCSKAPQAAQGPQAPPVITLWYSFQGDPAKGLEQVKNDLNKTNPGYQLQLVYVPPEQYMTNITRTLAAGKGPDIILASQDDLPNLVTAGSIRPLDKLFSPDKYFKASVEALTYNDNLLAVPKTVQVPLVAYNRDLIPNPPQSLEQLWDSANRAVHGQAVGLAGDLSNPFFSGGLFSAYGCQLFSADQKPALDSPQVQAFLQEVQVLAAVKAGTYDSATTRNLLAAGATPYALLDSVELGAYNALGKNLGYMNLPGPGGAEGKPYVKAQGYAISTNCNFPQQALAAAVYLASQPALAKYSIPQGEFPADPAAYDQPPLKDNPNAQLIRHIASIGTGFSADSRQNLILPIFSQGIKDVFNGTAPLDAANNAQNKALQAFGFDKP